MALKPDPNSYPLGEKDPDYLAQVQDAKENPSKWGDHTAAYKAPVILKAPLPGPYQPKAEPEPAKHAAKAKPKVAKE